MHDLQVAALLAVAATPMAQAAAHATAKVVAPAETMWVAEWVLQTWPGEQMAQMEVRSAVVATSQVVQLLWAVRPWLAVLQTQAWTKMQAQQTCLDEGEAPLVSRVVLFLLLLQTMLRGQRQTFRTCRLPKIDHGAACHHLRCHLRQ